MSSFVCEKCGAEIIDSPDGYLTECEHWPKIQRQSSMIESGEVNEQHQPPNRQG